MDIQEKQKGLQMISAHPHTGNAAAMVTMVTMDHALHGGGGLGLSGAFSSRRRFPTRALGYKHNRV